MRVSSLKAKARRLQNHVRERILHFFPFLTDGDVKCAIMGESGLDIHLSPRAQEHVPFDIECKNVERLNVWDALKQAEANCRPGRVPLLVFTRNRTPTYAALPLDALLALTRIADDGTGLKLNWYVQDVLQGSPRQPAD